MLKVVEARRGILCLGHAVDIVEVAGVGNGEVDILADVARKNKELERADCFQSVHHRRTRPAMDETVQPNRKQFLSSLKALWQPVGVSNFAEECVANGHIEILPLRPAAVS